MMGISHAAPTVDLRDAAAPGLLLEAAQNWGFAYVKGHGISESVFVAAHKGSRDFFSLSQVDKDDILADKSRALKTARGYAPVRGEQLDISDGGEPDLKEVLDVGLSSSSGAPHLGENMWPSSIPGLQKAVEEYADASAAVAKQVISLIGKSLGTENAFERAFLDPLRVARLTRYPAYNEVPSRRVSETSCGKHSDYGGVTVLHVQEPGLFVLRPNATGRQAAKGTFFPDLVVNHNDEWVEVPPKENSLVVIFGEALHLMSNGRIQTTIHRVDNVGEKARYSLAMFYDPSPDFQLRPLPELSDEIGPLYEPRFAGHKGVLLAAAMMSQLSPNKYLGYGRV